MQTIEKVCWAIAIILPTKTNNLKKININNQTQVLNVINYLIIRQQHEKNRLLCPDKVVKSKSENKKHTRKG